MIISLESSIRLLRYKSFFARHNISSHVPISIQSQGSVKDWNLSNLENPSTIRKVKQIRTDYLDVYNNIHKSNTSLC